jgi:photosystem II stability/assembly factor-like uncharacterized protein
MASSTSSTQKSYVYVGMGGETAPGRVVHTGLYRFDADGETWELLSSGLPEAPAIRALTIHPNQPNTIYAGTQEGPYRSDDYGDHWEKVNVPDRGQPVWSFLFHPRDPDVIYAGYENCEIYRSIDGGAAWERLPVSVRFPDISTAPGANPVKRVLMMAASESDPDLLFGAIEVGGIIRSEDGGETWENLSHGNYVNDDTVDMHGVLASRWRPDVTFSIGRAGMFRSDDAGDHWGHVPLKPLNAKGQIYCRDIREVPGNPRKLWVSAGADFQSDTGVLLHSRDGGDSWVRIEMGHKPGNTMFKLAFDERRPNLMSCTTNGGEVFSSTDAGETWQALPPLPEGKQTYALARA